MTRPKKVKPPPMKLYRVIVAATYDPEADAGYIYLNGKRGGKGSAAKTLTTGHRGIYINLDRNGRLLGIELLGGDIMPEAFMPEQDAESSVSPKARKRRSTSNPPKPKRRP